MTQAQDKVATAEAALVELRAVACGHVYKGVNQTRDNYNKQVAEVYSNAFLEGWLAYLTDLGIPENNPVWAKATLAPDFPSLLCLIRLWSYLNSTRRSM